MRFEPRLPDWKWGPPHNASPPDPIERGQLQVRTPPANRTAQIRTATSMEPTMRRVGNFALENVAHRTTPSMNRYAVSRARDFCVWEKLAAIVERRTQRRKSRMV